MFDPSTGHADDKTTYLLADDFIKDIDDKNPSGVAADSSYNNVAVNVWYDGKQNLVSATTTPTIHAKENIYADGNISGTNITASTAIRANNVSANTISAATKINTNNLDASGTVNITGATTIGCVTTINNNTNINGNVSVTGTVTASGAIYSSDRKLKENIEFVKRDEFNKVSNIFAKSYNFKSDENKSKMYGVIAQDVQEAGLPELVHTTDDNGTLGVDYTSLFVLKIAYLEDFCAMLNGRVVELENRIKELENKE